MNTNLIHNILNVLMIVIAGLTAALTAAGCTTLANGDLECSKVVWLSPTLATTVITVLGAVKVLINVVRDGFAGLTKNQPPVQ